MTSQKKHSAFDKKSVACRQFLLTTLFIGLTYLWTSTAYLSWTSHLTLLADNTTTYLATEAGGCITQIFGIILFAWLLRHDVKTAFNPKLIACILIVDCCANLPVAFSDEMIAVLLWGLAMNLFHGALAACYIARISCYISKNRRATCFGVGYAFGSLGSYLISLLGGEGFLATSRIWLVYVFFIFISCLLLAYMSSVDRSYGPDGGFAPEVSALPDVPGAAAKTPPLRITKDAIPFSSCVLAGAVVVFLSLTSQLLFFFLAQAYISNTAALEFSHMFSFVGLLIAAFVNDKKRNAGLILALLSLCFPLLSLSLYQLTYLLTVLAAFGYAVICFFTVYRIVVFVDLYDNDSRLLFLAPAGLLCGRFGEASGASLGFLIGSRHVMLTIATVTLFVITILLVFLLYVRLYSEKPVVTAEDRANRFYAKYDLSTKEQQVFLLLVDGMTNKEIADALFISENTVKFHVRNILKKTDCPKRADVVFKFQSFS